MAGIAKLQLLIDIKEKLNVGLNAAKQKVAKATGDIQTKLDSLSVNSTKAFSAIKDEIPGVARALELLSNPYVAAAAGAMAVATGIGIATTKAIEWRDQMAQVNTTARLGQKDLGDLSDKILNIAGQNSNDLNQVPLAFNRIISAGLDTNTSLATLEPTLRAAKAGFTDVETAAAAATSVMMAAGVDANKTFDVLFATQRAGNAEFKDIAMYLPKVIPIAKNVGFALEETAGAYAKLTGTLRPEAASTALEGIYRAFSDPNKAIGQVSKKTGKYITGFKSIGVDVFDSVTGKARPLISILNDVSKSMQGLSDKQKMLKFSKLGLDQEAALGFSTLLQNLPETKRIIGEVTNSQGEANKAFEAAKSPLDDWKVAMNLISVKIIQIGQLFIPTVEAIGRGVLFLTQNLDIIGGVLAGLGISWAFLNAQVIAQTAATLALKTATGIATAAQWAFNIAANANPIGLIVLAIGALIGGLVVAYNKFDKFRAIVQGTWAAVKEFGTILKDHLIDSIKHLLSGFGSLGKAIKLMFEGDFNAAYGEAKKGVIEVRGISDIKNAVDKTKGLDKTFANSYNKSMLESQKKKLKEKTDTNKPTTDAPTTPNNPTKPDNTPISSGAQGIKGGSQTKNITINIDSFIKGGLNPTHTSINSMSKDELERWLTEMFFRVIRSAETSS